MDDFLSFSRNVRVTFTLYNTLMTGEYQAYLLRLERGKGQQRWRATLENAQTGDVLHFASERDLLLHLLRALAHQGTPNADNPAAAQ